MKVLFVVLVAISSHIVCLDWRLPTLGILLSVANNDIITPAPEPASWRLWEGNKTICSAATSSAD